MATFPEIMVSLQKVVLALALYGGVRAAAFQPANFRKEEGLSLSPLVTGIEPSKTIEVHALTQAMRAAGQEVVSLCVGEPDFPPPAPILAATEEAVKQGLTKYTAVSGTAPLRQAIAAHLEERKGTVYDPASEILLGNGAKQAVYQAILATCRPGDEVILPAPYWPSYPEIVKLAGGTPVVVETKCEEGYILQPEALAAALSPKTRMLVLCNPSNPTGAVHDRAALQALADVLASPEEHGPGAARCWVMADEIYERLVYDGVEHVAFAALEGRSEAGRIPMWDRTLTVNGFSKAYAMTGYRLGYLAAPHAVVKACGTLQGQITSCASSVAQHAALAALQLDEAKVLAPLVDDMAAKRDLVYNKLRAMHGVKVPDAPPSGAFYLLPEVDAFFGRRSPGRLVFGPAAGLGASGSGLVDYDGMDPVTVGADEAAESVAGGGGREIMDSTSLCVALLADTGVAFVPGEAFGAPRAVRLSYAASREELVTALFRFEEWLLRTTAAGEDWKPIVTRNMAASAPR